jgi:hypothetical protein
MRIDVPHSLGQLEAVRRLDTILADLLQRPLPAGIELLGATRTWSAGRLDFSFKARKGFFGTTIGGFLDVTDTGVVLDAAIPPMVASFLGEERIRERIRQELAKVLA